MKQKTKQMADIIKLADELEKNNYLEVYWDYRDRLTDEQVLKILTKEEGLNDIENELYELNLDYISEQVREIIKNVEIELSEEEKDELRLELEGRFNFNIDNLIKNSEINLRVELGSNEDMIFVPDIKHSETLKEFKRVFRGKYKKEDLEKEINNATTDYALITFYFRVRGLDILKLREQILKGFITLKEGLKFGLFNSWEGSGSILEIELLKDITLNLRDWRIKNTKEGILKVLEEGSGKSYWEVMIEADSLDKYGIQRVYNLGGWQEW